MRVGNLKHRNATNYGYRVGSAFALLISFF